LYFYYYSVYSLFFIIFCLTFILFLSFVSTQPRPPHERPPADQLNRDCLADLELPKFTPTLDHETQRTLYCPQSDTTYYVVSRWILGFTHYYPKIVFNCEVVGSGIAGPCLADNSCAFSIVGREMLLAEQDIFYSVYPYPPFEFPVAGGSYAALAFTDGMTFMVHPTNPLTSVTLAQLDAAFSTTRNRRYVTDITTWGQLGVTDDIWKDRPINLIGVQIPNGFEYFLNRTVLLGGKWKQNITTRPTVFELATLVSEDPNSLGYTGLSFLNATVKQLSLSEGGGWPYTSDENFVNWDKKNVCDRTFPLSRLIYLYANKKPGETLDPVIKEFLTYILSYEGQRAVQDDMIFLPLNAKVANELRKQLLFN